MIYLILSFLLISTQAIAVTIENPDGRFHECTPEYSFKDFTGVKSVNIPDGTVVCRSCFSQEEPNTVVFRANMKNVTFVEGNLDNVFIPPTPFNEVVGSSRRSFKAQNDLEDWILNDDGTPKEPINKEDFITLGININPNNLPREKMNESITSKKRQELLESR